MKTLRSTQSIEKAKRVMQLMVALCVPFSAVIVLAGCTAVYDAETTTAPSTAVADSAATTSARVTTTTTLAPATTTTATDTSTTVASETTTDTTDAADTTDITSTTTTETSTTTTTLPDTTPQDTEETVLYAIDDWSAGVSGWAAAGQWKTVDGMLVTDGTSNSFAVAPVDLTGYPDYVVECELQFLDPEAGTVVALLARLINGTAYYGGFDGADHKMVVGYEKTELGSASFILDSDWHKYRLEVRGNSIKIFMEEAEVARATDNRILEPGTAGIYCGNGQINVRSFRVIAL